VFDFIIEHQFSKVDRSDVRVDFARERRDAAVLEVTGVPGVGRAEGMLQIGAELRNGWREKTVLVMGLPAEGHLYRVYDTSGRQFPIPPDGVIIPRRLAKWLDLRPGSRVLLDPYLEDKDERPVVVRGVVDQYVGLTVYADRDYLARVLGEGGMVNGALATAERGRLDQVVESLDEVPGIRAVSTPRAMMEDLRESIADLMRTAAVIQTIAAGIIAFAVIYNASSVNIAEQERDLASLRSLGYAPAQVAGVATDDIMPLTILGIAAGIPLGILACQGIAAAYETDIYKIPVVIDWSLFANAAIWLMVFSLIARWACRRRVRRIDIVRRLKTRE
jgi:putative ABC transport system permease protein